MPVTLSLRAEAEALGVSYQTVWRNRFHDETTIAGAIVPYVADRRIGRDGKLYPARRHPNIRARDRKIREYARNGVPQWLIARVLGCSTGTVWRITHTKRKRAKRRPSLSLKQQIAQRIEAGQSPRDIAAELGCTVPDIALRCGKKQKKKTGCRPL